MFPFWSNAPFAMISENLQLLRQRYYYATWKADGTRYMMLIMRDGCFLIDRNFCFRRVQMRFPHKSLEVRRPLCWENIFEHDFFFKLLTLFLCYKGSAWYDLDWWRNDYRHGTKVRIEEKVLGIWSNGTWRCVQNQGKYCVNIIYRVLLFLTFSFIYQIMVSFKVKKRDDHPWIISACWLPSMFCIALHHISYILSHFFPLYQQMGPQFSC